MGGREGVEGEGGVRNEGACGGMAVKGEEDSSTPFAQPPMVSIHTLGLNESNDQSLKIKCYRGSGCLDVH